MHFHFPFKSVQALIPVIIVISMCLLVACTGDQYAEKIGSVPNPSFEVAEGDRPAEWQERGSRRGGGTLGYENIGRTGTKSVMISSEERTTMSWRTSVPVKLYSQYRLSGWIKTENVTADSGAGASINLQGIRGIQTPPLTGTNDWRQVETVFETEMNDAVQINCSLGGRGQAVGKAWYDDISLELISSKELKPSIVIDAASTREPISKYIYGQFIEHLGRCIYGGLWAEMIGDRKFYYDFQNENSPWRVTGDTGAVSMVREDSFVGEQTPQIVLPGDGSAHGLIQGELGLIKDMGYEGRIVLSGEPVAAPVEISLVWGDGEQDRETVLIEDIGNEYKTVPLRFVSKKSTDSGSIEIISRGMGSFRIGTVSLMPENNIEGFRADVLALLKELDAPVYRWPGGNFVSGYNWRDGIGDRDRRPPRKNPAWQGIEPNDVGIYEFITLCRLIDTEPYVTVNTGLGGAESAAQEVEYCNGSIDTPMGKLRAENGHPEPFKVTWWAVGNEMYGSWQLGNVPVEQYVEKHNRVVEAMRTVDPDILLVAVGSVGRWDQAILAGCADYMDYISEHFYCQERPGIIAHAAQAPGQVRRISQAMREYRSTIPALAGKDIRIAMDEWNYWYGPHVYGELGTRYFLKDALGIAEGLHEYYRNSDIVFMANYAQTVNVIGCIKTTKTEAAFATTGLVLKLYRNHFGTVPVDIGGAPEPLDVTAAWSDDRTKLTVAIVNPTREKYDVPFELSGASLTGKGTRWLITGDEMAYNEPGKKPVVTIQEKQVNNITGNFEVSPISISLYVMPVEK